MSQSSVAPLIFKPAALDRTSRSLHDPVLRHLTQSKATWARRAVNTSLLCVVGVLLYITHTELEQSTLSEVREYYFSKPTRPANPYASEGYLSVNESDPHANRWHPYSDEPAPALWASVLRASWRDAGPTRKSEIGGRWHEESTGPDSRDWDDAAWARNRTVIVVGDSTSRMNLKYLCEMAGEPFVELDWDHPFSPSPPTEPLQDDYMETSLRDSSGKPSGMPVTPAGNPNTHQAHYCYVPGVDLLVMQIFNFGLDEDGFWKWRKTYTPPYKMEDRISYLAKGYMDRAAAIAGRNPSPDLVYLSSALWDSAKFQREDIVLDQSTKHPLSTERIMWYRQRVRSVLVTARRAFPSSSIKWISNSYPHKPSNGWFFENFEDNKSNKRPAQSEIRLEQMQAAARSAITELGDATPEEVEVLSEVTICPWGRMLLGYEDWQIDDLHPTLLPAGYLWADMLMYDLREAVLSPAA
ncbi:hypothetical protein EHS25_006121 [Saitozyma podzolica]|uniref:Uncharacterized protein n=1 Tax=Saitozyma podzolica TaxID=1890683 RepID=A0A427XTQ0_9TREE|nr:hypothetical protein EHS25_006121 [Saitozyma podzolica]